MNRRLLHNLRTVDVLTHGDGVKRIVLNEAKSYNALCLTTLQSLGRVISELNSDSSTRVIILEGAGNGFSAGHNLKEINNFRKEKNQLACENLFTTCSNVMLNIAQGNIPVIAQVHGSAFAAGCQLVASCDLAYSTEDAKFATPGVNIGLFCSTPMVAISRNIGAKAAMSMLLTGDAIGAKEAKDIGLINDYYPTKIDLDENVLQIADKIASKSKISIQIGKKAFYKQSSMPLKDAYNLTGKAMTTNLMLEDAKEGISAFLEKRKPEWKDK